MSYSYIAGIIVYILTVMLPVIWENYRLQPILKEQVKSIGIMLANMLVGFPYEEDYLKIDISDIEKMQTDIMVKQSRLVPFSSLRSAFIKNEFSVISLAAPQISSVRFPAGSPELTKNNV